MGKTIWQLDLASDVFANTDSNVFALTAAAAFSNAERVTMAQAKSIFGTKKLTYVGAGSETVIAITALAGKYIVSIFREAAPLYDIDSGTPDSTQYLWDETSITVSPAMNPGERLLIQYRNL